MTMLERNDWQLAEGIERNVNNGRFRGVKALPV